MHHSRAPQLGTAEQPAHGGEQQPQGEEDERRLGFAGDDLEHAVGGREEHLGHTARGQEPGADSIPAVRRRIELGEIAAHARQEQPPDQLARGEDDLEGGAVTEGLRDELGDHGDDQQDRGGGALRGGVHGGSFGRFEWGLRR